MNLYDATEVAYKNGYAKGKEDAEKQIVRCGKCKHYAPEYRVCQFWHGSRNPGHYCAEGERKCNG